MKDTKNRLNKMKDLNEQHLVEVLQLIQQNRKIEAIKRLIDTTNMGLKEAKDFVDELVEKSDLESIDLSIFNQSSQNQFSSMDYDHEKQNSFSKIQINHVTQDVNIITKDGNKFFIDESHPLWAEAMQFFTGKMFATKQDYIDSMRQKSDEWISKPNSKVYPENHPHSSSAFHHTNPSTMQGIEKNKPIFSLITIIVIILIIAVGIAILLS